MATNDELRLTNEGQIYLLDFGSISARAKIYCVFEIKQKTRKKIKKL